MRRSFATYLILAFALAVTAARKTGVPYFKNITAATYHAHNRNYDIACDDYGTVFVANFEGLVYYNGAAWHKIHTPGISRLTCLAKDHKGRIWAGGYNYLGYLCADDKGRIQLATIVSDTETGGIAEVCAIRDIRGKVYVCNSAGKTYRVKNGRLEVSNIPAERLYDNNSEGVTKEAGHAFRYTYSYKDGITVSCGDVVRMNLTEANGLLGARANSIAYDGRNTLWGATDEGLFAVDVVSPYSFLAEKEGLRGEVNCIEELDGRYFFGTMQGLFATCDDGIRCEGGIDLACWQMVKEDRSIIAATSDGLYRITPDGTTRLTGENTLSVCPMNDGEGYFTGETDGIYCVRKDGKRTRLTTVEKAVTIRQRKDVLITTTVFGQTWEVRLADGEAHCIKQKADNSERKIAVTDRFGTQWFTDAEGRNITTTSQTKSMETLRPWLHMLRKRSINAIFVGENGTVLAGGDFGVVMIDGISLSRLSPGEKRKPYIAEVVTAGDSLIWGGFGKDMKPLTEVEGLTLPSNCSNLTVRFACPTEHIFQPAMYRFRINGGQWSAWSEDNKVEFNNLDYGTTTLEVQALDMYGRTSEISHVTWYMEYPPHLRWWAILLYVIIAVRFTSYIIKRRTKRLVYEKEKLEKLVGERTAELSQTLEDLRQAQGRIVRMEKAATAGKMTQGLIDRILNPINYINNFSRLTISLAKDLKEDITDEKGNISKDTYEDCEDILEMMKQNLEKIEEHGTNTTRTLRAMEALLNNRCGALSRHDIVEVCRQITSIAHEHFAKELEEHGIALNFKDLYGTSLFADINVDSMTRIIMSLFANSIYAVSRKSETEKNCGSITLTAGREGNNAVITVSDNGTGIDDTIVEKVFDPFFTTKPTGEAAGVGLYLVRELIQEHNGNITVKSEKNISCEMIMTIPLSQAGETPAT